VPESSPAAASLGPIKNGPEPSGRGQQTETCRSALECCRQLRQTPAAQAWLKAERCVPVAAPLAIGQSFRAATSLARFGSAKTHSFRGDQLKELTTWRVCAELHYHYYVMVR